MLAAEALRASRRFLTLATERLGAVRRGLDRDPGPARSPAEAIEGMVAPVRASLEKVDEQIRVMEKERGWPRFAAAALQAVAETQDKLRAATGAW